MKPNLHSADRTMRIVIAAIIALLYFTDVISGTTGIVLMIVAIIFALTGAINFCPIYYGLGISTRKKEA
mgnify:CR=1 FL=1